MNKGFYANNNSKDLILLYNLVIINSLKGIYSHHIYINNNNNNKLFSETQNLIKYSLIHNLNKFLYKLDSYLLITPNNNFMNNNLVILILKLDTLLVVVLSNYPKIHIINSIIFLTPEEIILTLLLLHLNPNY